MAYVPSGCLTKLETHFLDLDDLKQSPQTPLILTFFLFLEYGDDWAG